MRGKQNEKKYQVYDTRGALFNDDPVFEAITAKEAIIKYMETKGESYKIKRSKDNDVIFRATPFREENGRKVKDGNDVWYARVMI